ncbi:GGDEF domain-containing protein [Bacillus salacetis]|uniref:GGDEF domain-containing protein n=1 Tax=Bacillus salacetis TaxID=2315464 RepID=UPI003BA1622A
MTNAMPLSLQKLKYRFYAVLVPIFLFVSSLGLYEESRSAAPNRINIVVLPLLVLLYIVCSFIVFFKKEWIERAEKFMIISICIVSAVKFTYVVNYELEETMSLGTFTFWMPLFYMFLFFLLNIRWALITMVSTYIWFLGVGIYKLPDLVDTSAAPMLIQYFFANLVFIITLFFLQTVKQRYIKAEVLDELANTDYLTSLPNRRKIDEELLRALDSKQPMSIIYLDVDHFKLINDEYGHSTGDKVLVEFINVIKKLLEETDFFGRWGGEEFIIIAKNRDVYDTNFLAEKIRNHVAEYEFETIYTLTASFGVTESQDDDTLDTLLNRADKALYEAKRNGRNQVVSNMN